MGATVTTKWKPGFKAAFRFNPIGPKRTGEHAQIENRLINSRTSRNTAGNVCVCVGTKKDGEEFKCKIINKNMAI